MLSSINSIQARFFVSNANLFEFDDAAEVIYRCNLLLKLRAYLQLGGDGILIHVDVVFVERLHYELVAFGLHPCRAEGR